MKLEYIRGKLERGEKLTRDEYSALWQDSRRRAREGDKND